MESPVFEKGYPDYDAVNRNNMGDLKFTTAVKYNVGRTCSDVDHVTY